jgi:hypothetical protein
MQIEEKDGYYEAGEIAGEAFRNYITAFGKETIGKCGISQEALFDVGKQTFIHLYNKVTDKIMDETDSADPHTEFKDPCERCQCFNCHKSDDCDKFGQPTIPYDSLTPIPCRTCDKEFGEDDHGVITDCDDYIG